MASSSLQQRDSQPQTHHYSIKEFQLIVREAPPLPVELEPFVGCQYCSSADVYRAFSSLKSLPVETFIILHLDGKNRMVGMTTISLGSMPSSLVHPREVFRPAHSNLTAGLILIHNYPSGEPEPSQEDVNITRRLCEVGKLIGIQVLDHIVVGSGRYFSFADEGLLS